MSDPRSHKRFGTIATELGLLTRIQLYEALKRQVEDVLTGKPRQAIGQILRAMGVLSVEQVAEIVLLQQRNTPVILSSGIRPRDPAAPWPFPPVPGKTPRPLTAPVAREDR